VQPSYKKYKQDHTKLKRVLEYVKGSIYISTTMGAESLNNIQVHKMYD